ncbi:MAG: DEAD/DEAH box helicase [bacterium]|nr:DEAD/DEAH box helicase [bacterium]
MSLQKRCLNEVQPRDRERGAGYFHQRRVSLGAKEHDGIAATVEGSGANVYEVRLDWSRAELEKVLGVSCTCPRFEVAFCKHVWATIVAFDRAQFTEPVPGTGRLELESSNHTETAATATATAARIADLLPQLPQSLDPFFRDTGYPHRSESGWQRQLGSIRAALAEARRPVGGARWSQRREVCYRLNIASCFKHDEMVVDIYQRKARKSGELGKPAKLNMVREPLDHFSELDQELLRLFQANPTPGADPYGGRYYASHSQTRGIVPPRLYASVLPRLCATRRLGWVRNSSADLSAAPELAWDAGPVWRFVLRLERSDDDDENAGVRIVGLLRRDEESKPLSEPVLLLANGAVVWNDRISRLEKSEAFPWVSVLRQAGEIRAPLAELDLLLEDLASLPELPELEMPAEWRWQEARPTPRPRLSLRPTVVRGSTMLEGDVGFDYEGCVVPARTHAPRVFDRARRRVVHRDPAAEHAAFERLSSLGMKSPSRYRPVVCDVQLSEKALLRAIEPLLSEGWVVEAEGRLVRPPGEVRLSVASDIDWFELRGDVEFESTSVALPRLLRAVRRGERMIRLDDGTRGMLPEEWIERYGPLARLAHGSEGDAVRYLPSQAALLDTLLEAEPSVDVDRRFAGLRERIRSFESPAGGGQARGVEPLTEPRGFHGELRAYQRDGLGWLRFLEDLGLGGCLADDMGLGKTVQVLALLQARRLRRRKGTPRRPSLIVAPRSLIHNWIEETARFTPRLRALSYTGPRRDDLLPRLTEHDLVVTTYGLVRRDVTKLRDVVFDYAILDEAQAIKNSSSQSAKACRLIRADHRLALTGTPVENHLGELWSIFEFLNPGMLGGLPAFKTLAQTRSPDGETLGSLRRAIRPFVLRRTKEEVLKDLPAKTEQTLYCELGNAQMKLYQELRDHYRASLDERIEDIGLERAKIHVLEALLRLRQAACHPALLDQARENSPSAKLETLLEQLEEVIEGGHKALVFSQFVRLLQIVKRRLERRKTTFEYLDGKTRDRQARIDRFQNDADCKLFLISLKAGGLGLNLTAADYVFILDPWWNPAVEAQAVDRAHRIGQNRPVFAYRLIASETVEEKILELQESKRELADAILSASGGMMRDLTAEDLRLLLS